MEGDIMQRIRNIEWRGGAAIEDIRFFIDDTLFMASNLVREGLDKLNMADEGAYRIELGHYVLINGLDALSEKLAEWDGHTGKTPVYKSKESAPQDAPTS